jgi:hypothetical protein
VGPTCRPPCHHVLRPISYLGQHSLVTVCTYKSRFRPERSKAPTAGLKPHLTVLNCLCPHTATTFIFGEELTRVTVLFEAPTALSEARPIHSCRIPVAASLAPSSKHHGSHTASSFSPVEHHLHCRLPRELGCATFLMLVRLAAHCHASTPSCQSTASRHPSVAGACTTPGCHVVLGRIAAPAGVAVGLAAVWPWATRPVHTGRTQHCATELRLVLCEQAEQIRPMRLYIVCYFLS